MAHAACVRRIAERTATKFEDVERSRGSEKLSQASHSVETALMRKYAQITLPRDRWLDLKRQAVTRFGSLRELCVAVLLHPRQCVLTPLGPPLSFGPHPVRPQNQTLPGFV